jgi:hypothetical protein
MPVGIRFFSAAGSLRSTAETCSAFQALIRRVLIFVLIRKHK